VTTAIADRLVYNSKVLILEGKSYRVLQRKATEIINIQIMVNELSATDWELNPLGTLLVGLTFSRQSFSMHNQFRLLCLYLEKPE
jgi:hypothetical protein